MMTTLFMAALLALAVSLASEAALHALPDGLPYRRVPSPGDTAYYVDAQKGGDSNPGTSPQTAWKSLARIHQTVFAPGDRLLFAGGQAFAGTLKFPQSDSGRKGKPILVSSFGQDRATIQAGAGDGF